MHLHTSLLFEFSFEPIFNISLVHLLIIKQNLSGVHCRLLESRDVTLFENHLLTTGITFSLVEMGKLRLRKINQISQVDTTCK